MYDQELTTFDFDEAKIVGISGQMRTEIPLDPHVGLVMEIEPGRIFGNEWAQIRGLDRLRLSDIHVRPAGGDVNYILQLIDESSEPEWVYD